MTAVLIVVIAVLTVVLAALAARHVALGRSHPAPAARPEDRRILFPFLASTLSARALDAALRLAGAEDATLMPVFLARVPLTLPLDAPLPRQSGIAIPLQEAIEQRAAAFGVPVDSRIERGRTHRHALRQTIAHERYDRIVLAAASAQGLGFGPDDVAWVLAQAPGDIVVLRSGAEDRPVPITPRPRRARLSFSRVRASVSTRPRVSGA